MRGVVVEEKWREVSIHLDQAIYKATAQTASELEGEIKGAISGQSNTMVPWLYNRTLVDTGAYLGSWTQSVAIDGRTAEVASPIEYAKYLEYGHYTRRSKKHPERQPKWVPARPHIVPSAKRIAAKVPEIFKSVMAR